MTRVQFPDGELLSFFLHPLMQFRTPVFVQHTANHPLVVRRGPRARARDSSSKANASTRASSFSASIQYHPMIASDRKLYPRHVDLESTRLALICRSFFCGSCGSGSGSRVPFRVSCVSLAMRARPVQHNANCLVVPASLFEPQRPFYPSRIVIWTWIES